MKEFSTLVNIWRSYNLQAKSLTVSYTPFALHFCRQRCRSRQISLITCVLQTETVIMDNIFKRFFVCSLFGNSSGFLIGGCLVGLPIGHGGAQCDVPSQRSRSTPRDTVQPLWRFPAFWTRPACSFCTGMPAAPKARLIQPFKARCLTTRLGACLQTKPWVPVASNKLPQQQACGLPSSEPSVTMRTASSSSSSSSYYY